MGLLVRKLARVRVGGKVARVTAGSEVDKPWSNLVAVGNDVLIIAIDLLLLHGVKSLTVSNTWLDGDASGTFT